jgi:hypothetical protein
MSKRMRELAEQAGYYIDPDFDIEFEVFAELIVRECANYAYSDDQDHKAMLKHFGVEEK